MATDLNLSEKLKGFLDVVDYCRKAHNVAIDMRQQQDKIQQDLLHDIEFCSNCKERSKLATKLRECRLERRYWKDLEEETGVVNDWLSGTVPKNNKQHIDELKRLLGAARKVEAYHENRIYHRRALPNV